MPRYSCDQCGFEEHRGRDQEPWLCPVCGWYRWSVEEAAERPEGSSDAASGAAASASGPAASASDPAASAVHVDTAELIDAPVDGRRYAEPHDVAVDPDGVLLILDSGNQRLVRLREGEQARVVSLEPQCDAEDTLPRSLALDPDGRVHVALSAERSSWLGPESEGIVVLSPTLEPIASFAEHVSPMPVGGLGPGALGTLNRPVGIDVAEDGRVYVAEGAGGRIQVFSRLEQGDDDEGLRFRATDWWGNQVDLPSFEEEVEAGTWGTLSDVLVRGNRVFVIEALRPVVHIFDLDGNPEGCRELDLGDVCDPAAITALPSGDLALADAEGHRLLLLSPAGAVRGAIGGPGMKPGQFLSPQGLACGPDGEVFVADTGNHRVQVLKGIRGGGGTATGSAAHRGAPSTGGTGS